jgi:hypothetical protein
MSAADLAAGTAQMTRECANERRTLSRKRRVEETIMIWADSEGDLQNHETCSSSLIQESKCKVSASGLIRTSNAES